MTSALDVSIRALLRASLADEVTLAFPLNDQIFGLHAQQAVEKMLKALIAAHAQRYQHTHDLEALLTVVVELGEVLPLCAGDFPRLTRFAGVFRYQDPAEVEISGRSLLRSEISEFRIWTTERIRTLRPDADFSDASLALPL